MTLPSSGSLSLFQINAEFNRGYNLTSYVGVQWWTDAGGSGYFAAPITVSQFYGKRVSSPATVTSQSFLTNGTFTVPTYSTMIVTLRGGSGGSASCTGNLSAGADGGPGGYSYFGSYGYAVSGAGGTTSGVDGASGAGSDGSPAGAPAIGGNDGLWNAAGGGGDGGKTILTLYHGSSGPAIGAAIAIVVGAGGSGAAYAGTYISNAGGTAYAPSGVAGSSGSVSISWS